MNRIHAVSFVAFVSCTILVGQARRGEHRVGLRLIPRFVWANRGVTEMTVWMARDTEYGEHDDA